MANIKELLTKDKNIEIAIAAVLFLVASFLGAIVEFVIYILYFIIFLEIVRALMGFIVEKRVQIRILINAFIVLSLREFIVNVVKINKEEITSWEQLWTSPTNFHIIIFAGVILFLFFLRYLAVVISPEEQPTKP
jgi:uncharacterized membrane protein (DUF373 family)